MLALAHKQFSDRQYHRKQTAWKQARVKRRGKSSPRKWQRLRQDKPHLEQGQAVARDSGTMATGRLLKVFGDKDFG